MERELMFMLAIWVANFNPLVCGLLASGPRQPTRREGAMIIAAMRTLVVRAGYPGSRFKVGRMPVAPGVGVALPMSD